MQHESRRALKDFIISAADIMRLKTKDDLLPLGGAEQFLAEWMRGRLNPRSQPRVRSTRQNKLCGVMRGDVAAEMSGETIDGAFVPSLITGVVFVVFG